MATQIEIAAHLDMSVTRLKELLSRLNVPDRSDMDAVRVAYYRDEAGNKTPFLPDNTVIAGSAALDGVRAFGAILDQSAGYQALEIFPKNWISQDPAVEFVMSQSAPLLVPRHPNAVVAATVR